MNKKIIPIIIIVVAVIAIVVFFYFSKGKVTTTTTLIGNGPTVEVGKTITSKTENFTGKLLDAVEKGTPYKCTYKLKDMSGIGYIKNRKYYGEIETGGKPGFVIMSGKCIWTWEKGKTEGAKVCLDGDIWSLGKESENQQVEGDYVCTQTTINDDLFIPPNNVQFIDVDQMMQNTGQDQ